MLKILAKKWKTILFYTIIITLISSLLTLYITTFVQNSILEAEKNELLKTEQNIISTENKVISTRIRVITGDLLYLADSLRLKETHTQLISQWTAFSNRQKIYDQIRYIDLEGNEIIRINYHEDGAVAIGPEGLQNKRDRYYFKDAIKLKENQIYISKLDLNVENDQIEQPIKPMIRIATPYYADGRLQGIIIVNYLANDMLNQVRQVASAARGDIYLLNSDGYWLYNSDNHDKEWTFMYEEQAEVSFKNEYPEEWKTIQEQKYGYQLSDNGIFSYSTVIASQVFAQENQEFTYVTDSGDWHLVSFVAPDSSKGILLTQNVWKLMAHTMKAYYYFYIFNVLIAFVISALVAITKNERERIKFLSEHDAMTGAYNRQAGFLRLSQLHKRSAKDDCTISVCFLDINGLKDVNDVLGHEAGNELIHSVVDGIKRSIRHDDFIARLGGDEFLIIFKGLDESQAEQIWKRIVKEYERINENDKRKYLISVSHGIESYQCDSDRPVDDIVKQADKKMYEEKRRIKNELNILRNP